MVQVLKPDDLSVVWAEAGRIQRPTDTKIVTGWELEIPPLEIFNWQMNRADSAISHINQRGIAEWDANTEYQAGVSYAQGSDGVVYKCLTTGIGLNPIETKGVNWTEAWLSLDGTSGDRKFIGFNTRSSTFTASINTRYHASGPLDMYLPTAGSVGDAVVLSKAPGITIKVHAQGNLIITAAGSDTDVYHDYEGLAYFVHNGTNWEA